MGKGDSSSNTVFLSKVVSVLCIPCLVQPKLFCQVIVLERNRRIAKAYARAPVLTVNGTEDGFDGFRIGVNGFENPMRDSKVAEFKTQIGAGCKLKMDDSGVSKGNIYVKNTAEETAVSSWTFTNCSSCLM